MTVVRRSVEASLKRARRDTGFDLGETALVLASRRRPGVPLGPYRRHLARLAEETAAYVHASSPRGTQATPLALRAEALRQVIGKRYRYQGSEAALEESDGANLMRVIDYRSGLPVALAIFYLQAARALSWPAVGIDFPVRFLVRLEAAGERVILDPFEGGRMLAPRDLRAMLTAEAGNGAAFTFADMVETDGRAVLLKLQQEAKIRLVEEERFQDAAETAETAALLDPTNPAPWRDMGFLFAHAGETKRAVDALVEYLKREGDRAKAAEAEALLGTLRRQLI